MYVVCISGVRDPIASRLGTRYGSEIKATGGFLLVIVGPNLNRIRKHEVLQRPQKRSRGNQLIRRRLSQAKSIGKGQNTESQAGIQSDGYHAMVDGVH